MKEIIVNINFFVTFFKYFNKKACELNVSFFEKGLRNCFYFSFQIITFVMLILGIGFRRTLKINRILSIEVHKPKPFIVVFGGITTLCVFLFRNPCDPNPCSHLLQICKKISDWEHKCEYPYNLNTVTCNCYQIW